MINYLPIKSQGLAQAGYDESAQVLFITFQTGATYKYFEVPQNIWDEFSATFQTDVSSNGYFMDHIRSNFKFERLRNETVDDFLTRQANAGGDSNTIYSVIGFDEAIKNSERIEKELTELENLFKYHAPTPDQAERYGLINKAAYELAKTIIICCPPSDDRTAAIRQVREARMTANASIACNE